MPGLLEAPALFVPSEFPRIVFVGNRMNRSNLPPRQRLTLRTLGVGKLGLVLVFLPILPHEHQALSAPYRETTSAKQGCPTLVKPC